MIRDIQELYRHRSNGGGVIDEHLPLLFMLSVQSGSVVEFGVDRGMSTSAILAGQDDRHRRGLPASYRGVDPNEDCAGEIQRLNMLIGQRFPVMFTRSTSLLIPPIEPTDFLFIDSTHSEGVIRAELQRHLPQVRRYVAMHDTVSFGENGETKGSRGILYGIEALLCPAWVKVYDSPRNNGMAVFERA